MAKYGGANCGFFLIDGYSVLSVLTDITEEAEAITVDAKPLGDRYPKPTPTGDYQYAITQNGFYDAATDSINDALADKEGTTRTVCLNFEGNTIGKKCVGVAGSYASKYSRISQKNDLTKANASYAVAGVKEEPVILHELAQEAGDGNTEGAESVNNLAATTGGGSGYLQVSGIALSGRPNVTVKVRHSSDDITYADLIAFTAVTARTAERKTVAGTINQHLATSWAWGGAGGAPTVTFMVGLHRNPNV